MFQTILIITTTARTSESLREFSPTHVPLCKVVEAILHDSCGGSITKTAISNPTAYQRQQLFLDLKSFCGCQRPRRFAAGSSPSSSIRRFALLSMFGATFRALVQGYSHPCEVKVPANCAVSKYTSISKVGLAAATPFGPYLLASLGRD